MLFIKSKECYLLSTESELIAQFSTIDLRQGTYNIFPLTKLRLVQLLVYLKTPEIKRRVIGKQGIKPRLEI